MGGAIASGGRIWLERCPGWDSDGTGLLERPKGLCSSEAPQSAWSLGVVLVVKLVGHHSCGADRLPVAVRFPAGPRVRLKTVDPPKGNGLGQKNKQLGHLEPIGRPCN